MDKVFADPSKKVVFPTTTRLAPGPASDALKCHLVMMLVLEDEAENYHAAAQSSWVGYDSDMHAKAVRDLTAGEAAKKPNALSHSSRASGRRRIL